MNKLRDNKHNNMKKNHKLDDFIEWSNYDKAYVTKKVSVRRSGDKD